MNPQFTIPKLIITLVCVGVRCKYRIDLPLVEVLTNYDLLLIMLATISANTSLNYKKISRAWAQAAQHSPEPDIACKLPQKKDESVLICWFL